MKAAFNKLMEKELDNFVYVVFALSTIAMSGWLDIPTKIEPMLMALLGVFLVKIKGA